MADGSMQMSAPWLSIVGQHQAPIHRSPSSYIEGSLLQFPSCLSITSIALSSSHSSWQSNPQQRRTTPPPIPQSVPPYRLSLPKVRTSSSRAAAQESDPKSQKPSPSPERQASPSSDGQKTASSRQSAKLNPRLKRHKCPPTSPTSPTPLPWSKASKPTPRTTEENSMS